VKKKPAHEEIVVDGDTLEKRRDQRAEQLERFVWGLTPEQRKGILGYVNQWTQEAGTQVVPASQSVFNLDAKQKQLREYTETHEFDAPPVVKRTPNERVESMVARLKTASPETIEPILKEVASEYWKAGAPVTVDALRAVAAHYLNRTERRKK
jgi:hypothetical protein